MEHTASLSPSVLLQLSAQAGHGLASACLFPGCVLPLTVGVDLGDTAVGPAPYAITCISVKHGCSSSTLEEYFMQPRCVCKRLYITLKGKEPGDAQEIPTMALQSLMGC